MHFEINMVINSRTGSIIHRPLFMFAVEERVGRDSMHSCPKWLEDFVWGGAYRVLFSSTTSIKPGLVEHRQHSPLSSKVVPGRAVFDGPSLSSNCYIPDQTSLNGLNGSSNLTLSLVSHVRLSGFLPYSSSSSSTHIPSMTSSHTLNYTV